MGHYDSSRPGYCAGCGAAPGNIINGVCEFCGPKSKSLKGRVVKPQPLRLRGGPRTTVPERLTVNFYKTILKYDLKAEVCTVKDETFSGPQFWQVYDILLKEAYRSNETKAKAIQNRLKANGYPLGVSEFKSTPVVHSLPLPPKDINWDEPRWRKLRLLAYAIRIRFFDYQKKPAVHEKSYAMNCARLAITYQGFDFTEYGGEIKVTDKLAAVLATTDSSVFTVTEALRAYDQVLGGASPAKLAEIVGVVLKKA